MRHGEGSAFYKKGEKYEGMWMLDRWEGLGTLWSPNNSKYVGSFKGDKKNGKG
jgi:hypothetical protein